MIVAVLLGLAASVATYVTVNGRHHAPVSSNDDQDPGLIP